MLRGRMPMPAAILIVVVLVLSGYAGSNRHENQTKASCDAHGETLLGNKRYLCAPVDKPKPIRYLT